MNSTPHPPWCCSPTRAMTSSFWMRFLDHMQRRTTVGRTPMDEWSALRRDLYLTTHNTHNRQTSMPPAGFEPTISAGERPQTYALDRAATFMWNINVYLQYLLCYQVSWHNWILYAFRDTGYISVKSKQVNESFFAHYVMKTRYSLYWLLKLLISLR